MSSEKSVERTSFEQAIRQKQAFEKKLAVFLKLVRCMTNDEIEITTARLADQISNSKESHKYLRQTLRVKGAILSTYFRLRVAKSKKYSHFARIKMGLGEDSIIESACSFELDLPPFAMDLTSEDFITEKVKLLAS